MKRREFITLLGGARGVAARSAGAAAGDAGGRFPRRRIVSEYAVRLGAFRRGLSEAGYVEGENVTIEYRWAENQRGPAAGVGGRVGSSTGRGDRHDAETRPRWRPRRQPRRSPVSSPPAEDPVKLGLVASLARPGGNVTGINFLAAEVAAKRLELLRDWCPRPLKSPCSLTRPAPVTETILREVDGGRGTMGLQIQVLKASSSGEIDAAFATFVHDRPDALFVGIGAFLFTADGSSSSTWRRATRSPRPIGTANLPRPAGS